MALHSVQHILILLAAATIAQGMPWEGRAGVTAISYMGMCHCEEYGFQAV